MRKFALIFRNDRGTAVDVYLLDTPPNVATIEVIAAPIDDPAVAISYRNQLLTHFNIPVAPIAPSAGSKRSRVKCMQTSQIFRSAAEAARHFGVSTSAMTKHLRDPETTPTVRNHTFTYADAAEHHRVICNETGIIYDGLAVAAQVFNVTPAQMRRAILQRSPVIALGQPYTLAWHD